MTSIKKVVPTREAVEKTLKVLILMAYQEKEFEIALREAKISKATFYRTKGAVEDSGAVFAK